MTFEPVEDGNVHELIIERRDILPQPCFEVFSDLEKFRTKDVFSQHPSKPDIWKFEGRVDDIVTLSNGEKFSPNAIEDSVNTHPDVTSALVVGNGRFQPALIVETPPGSSVRTARIVSEIWPLVETTNQTAPAYGRISKALVLTYSGRFLRTPKCTIQRRKTEQALAEDVEALYSSFGAETSAEMAEQHDLRSVEGVQACLGQICSAVVGADLDPDTHFFANGLDSMMVAEVVQKVNAAIRKSTIIGTPSALVTPALLYQHRNISGLSHAMRSHIHNRYDKVSGRPGWQQDHRNLLDKHIRGLPSVKPRAGSSSSAAIMQSVILTGSTGSLGTHFLPTLLR